MNWKTVKPMDQKVLFIADSLRKSGSFADLCKRYGISRKTGYKWLKRYHADGIDGLQEQSRRPNRHPETTPYTIRQAIIEIRQSRRILTGAKKIQSALANRFPNEHIPSHTTINNILRSEGLLRPRKKYKRITPYTKPFAPVNAPNELWSTDFKGHFKLGNGKYCYPLTVMDHHSRFLMGCDGLMGTRHKETKQAFTHLFKIYGLPDRIRSDNGVPFAARTLGGLSRLSVWWIRLGILPERIQPGCPQQNGRHERMHRTLKAATTQPVAASLRAQQRQFDRFKAEYNMVREHESLKNKTPADCYQPAKRAYPNRLPELEYPDYFECFSVRENGVIYWNNGQVYLSHVLAGETIGLECIDDGVWAAYFGPVHLGQFNQRDGKGGQTPYWTVKV
jgi:transposase InsO family protein